jgi:hypothetical protein
LAAVVSVAAAFIASGALAQEPLRWKLKPGDALKYHMPEEMTLPGGVGSAESGTTTVRQEMDMAWVVESVSAKGDAVIGQKFDNVKLKLVGPKGERIEYDSQGDEETASLAAMVAPIYDAMTAEPFTFTMTSRGMVKDVKVPEKVLAVLKNSPGAEVLGEMATAEGLQRMIMKWSLVLPEQAPAAGDRWSATIEVDAPTGGQKKIEMSYRYDGTKEIDGRTFAVVYPELEMTFAGNGKAQAKVVEQDSSGEILFDPQAGRIHSAKIKRSVTLDVTADNRTEHQQISQTLDVQAQ